MAKYEFNTEKTLTKKQEGFKVNFFSLKNDGEEAIVRFNYDTPKEFDMETVHSIKQGNKYLKVSCNKDWHDPTSHCALCDAGDRVATKFFAKLLVYTQDQGGRVVANAVVWERPYSFAKTLAEYYNEYGSLKDLVFKIKRHGAAGSMETYYDLIVPNQMVYKPEIYVKDFSAFDDFKLEGVSYKVKTNEEMAYYLDNGEFPANESPAQPLGPNEAAKKLMETPKEEAMVEAALFGENPFTAPATAEVKEEKPDDSSFGQGQRRRYTYY